MSAAPISLPINAEVDYYPDYLHTKEADELYSYLISLPRLTNPAVTIAAGVKRQQDYGKLMFIQESSHLSGQFPDQIWGNTAIWPDILLPIKARIEKLTHRSYGNCVCIYYPNGSSWVDFHSDFIAFGDTSVIPSISLGEERDFSLREKSMQDVHTVNLAHGSLIIMGKHCQERYEHSLPVDPRYKKPRINLTFRSVD